MSYPKRWTSYTKTSKDLGLPVSEALGAWASRFRAARSLKGLVFEDLSIDSQNALFVAQKLTMSDSAIESFERALGLEVGTMSIVDSDIAFELWDVRLSELSSLMSKVENRKLRLAFEAFCSLDENQVQTADLRFIIRAFRHINSHGVFNPASADLYRANKYSKTLLELAEAGLDSCEAEFLRLLDDGTLASDLSVENKARHFLGLVHKTSLYVGEIRSIELVERGLLIRRSHEPAWQLFDFSSMTLSQPSLDASVLPSPLIPRLQENVLEAHLPTLGMDDLEAHVAWLLPDELWLMANREKFSLYDPTSESVLREFFLPKGLRPYFLNSAAIGLTSDSRGAVITMSGQSDGAVYLDFDSGILKVLDLDKGREPVYSSHLDAFISPSFDWGSSLFIDFYSAREIATSRNDVGEANCLMMCLEDEIVDFPDSTHCFLVSNFRQHDLVLKRLDRDETIELGKVSNVLKIDDARFLGVTIEGELALLFEDAREPQTLSEVGPSAAVTHFSVDRKEASVVLKNTNTWLRLNTKNLESEIEAVSNVDAIDSVVIGKDGSSLVLGRQMEAHVFARIAEGQPVFSVPLPRLSSREPVLVVNSELEIAIIWSRFEPVLYALDLRLGKVIKCLEFGSGVLDAVWAGNRSNPSIFITLYGEFEIQELDLETGELSHAFTLPNPGMSMRVSDDGKSMLVIAGTDSDSRKHGKGGGWLVECSLT
jgi:hypothetical protein